MKYANILGKPYKVEIKSNHEIHELMGIAQRDRKYIALNEQNGPEQQEDTLLHEVMHIIDRELALGFNEETIQRLSCGLHSA